MFRVHGGVRLCISLLVLGALVGSASAQKPGTTEKDVVSALIDKLPDTIEEGIGYMSTVTGSGFLPLGFEEPGAMLLFQNPVASSGTLRELVKRGALSVPQLIAHLDDKRPTSLGLAARTHAHRRPTGSPQAHGTVGERQERKGIS